KSQFMSFHRSELFGITDLLANIGGILDLFLGFSFLSLVEILYFITLRLGVAIRRDIVEEKKKRWLHNGFLADVGGECIGGNTATVC
ncbi:Uncharacterized protein OBRU01_17991, partial [Operophtera brumata]